MKMKVAVIGGGSWGSALSIRVAENGHSVKIYDIDEKVVEEINENRTNERYVPDVSFPEGIRATSDLQEAVSDVEVILVVVPSHVVRRVISQLKGFIREDHLLISATKGLEEETGYRMSTVIASELGKAWEDKIVVLSGPTHAEEVSRGIPSAIVAASRSRSRAEAVQDLLMSTSFRIYTNPDLIGVELGGSVKNIIAIAAGISDGLGNGDNTKAALITRGLTEMARLGTRLGAVSLTFAGLAGMGDLVVTCTSMHSRNRRLGFKLGQGKSLEEALGEMNQVAEGVRTTRAVYQLAERLKIEMPITFQTYQVLFKGKDPRIGMEELMSRGKKHEIEGVVQNLSWAIQKNNNTKKERMDS